MRYVALLALLIVGCKASWSSQQQDGFEVSFRSDPPWATVYVVPSGYYIVAKSEHKPINWRTVKGWEPVRLSGLYHVMAVWPDGRSHGPFQLSIEADNVFTIGPP